MRSRTKNILCCVGSTIALSVFFTVPTFADTTTDTQEEIQVDHTWDDKVAANVNTSANIRTDASIDSSRVGRLPRGGTATVTGEKDGWIQVASGEVEGFIRGDLLVSGEEAKNLYIESYGDDSGSVVADRVDPEPEPSVETSVSVSGGDLDLMAAIIECEAGGESYEGKVAVGAVIMNRINSKKFPNSLSEVIYQSGQFSPVASGKLSRVLGRGARQDCYDAAAAVLNGANTIGDKLYFNSGSGKGIQIGNQHFY